MNRITNDKIRGSLKVTKGSKKIEERRDGGMGMLYEGVKICRKEDRGFSCG